jgi:DNA primase
LSSHKAGIANIVAPLGTALTSDQVNLLKRYCETIYFALDTDTAGQKALIKDLGIVDAAGMSAFVLDIGKYQDVDELITNGGNWEETVKAPKDVVIYFIETLQKKFDLTKPLEKNKFIKQILEIVTRINNPVLINDYLNKLVSIVKIDIAVLSTELKKIKDIMKTKNLETLPETVVLKFGSSNKLENEGMRVKYFLGLLMNINNHKSLPIEKIYHEIKELFPNEMYHNVFESVMGKSSKTDLSEEEFKIYSDCALLPVETFEDDGAFLRELKAIINRLKKDKIIKEIEEIKNDPDLDLSPQKLKELQRLTKGLI